MEADRTQHRRPNGHQRVVIERTSKLAKRLEQQLVNRNSDNLLTEIRQLQRSLNTLESDLVEERSSLGEAC